MQEHNIEDLFRMYTNGIYMLTDRGYVVTDPINNIDKFIRTYFSEKNVDIYLYDDVGSVVLYINKKKRSFIKKDFDNAIRGIDRLNTINKIILAVSVKIGQKILKYIDPDKIDPSFAEYNISFINTKSLIINLPKHDYIPKHILYRGDSVELNGILEKKKKEDLPKILNTDPISIWYGAKIGDVFKIIRAYTNKIHDEINEINLNNNIKEIVYREVIEEFKKMK